MSLFFQDATVTINNSGLLADNASISSTNGLESINLFGFDNSFNKTITGPFQGEFSVGYIVEASNDPIYSIVNYLRTGVNTFHFDPNNIVAGNISGSFYLRNYSISVAPNSLIKSNASFITYNQLSGSYQPTPRYKSQDSTVNGLNVIYLKNGVEVPNVIYEFRYSFEAQWSPEYILGQVQPLQVQLSNKNEVIQLVRDFFGQNVYSGISFNNFFNNEFDTIRINNTGNNFLEFSLTGFRVKSEETNINTNNIVLQTITLIQ